VAATRLLVAEDLCVGATVVVRGEGRVVVVEDSCLLVVFLASLVGGAVVVLAAPG